jgi:L-2-hydroxyglutarate oxidase LhgO
MPFLYEGLTIVCELRKRYSDTSITELEKELNVGQNVSSHNSGNVYIASTAIPAFVL